MFLHPTRAMVYHAYHYGQVLKGPRVMLLDAVRFSNSTGWPTVGIDGHASYTLQPDPPLGSVRVMRKSILANE